MRWVESHPSPDALTVVAGAYAGLGDRDAAVRWLERARAGGIRLWYTMHDPVFAVVAADPRFQRLLDELKPRR